MTRVFVTGLGVVSPVGLTAEETWQSFLSGISGAAEVRHFDTAEHTVKFSCEVKDFDPVQWIDKKSAKRMAPATQYSVAAARQAVEDAGIEITDSNRDNIGVVVNTGAGGTGMIEDATRGIIKEGLRTVSPFLVPIIMPNAVSCLVSIEMGIRGPILTSTLACASGNYAVVEGYHLLQRGEAEVILAGGAECSHTAISFAALARMGALSSRNDDPKRASRPFDKDRDGFVMGEGAAILVLETEEHARARGAKLYAEVLGGALTGDGYHITAPAPDGNGAARAMTQALKFSKLKAEDVDVIFAHGTSTPLNDPTETKVIKQALGEHAKKVAVSATKSMVGHMMGAAGAISAFAAAKTLYHGIIPPTINLETPDPECDLDYVPNVARKQDVKVAMVNAFGFGGQNVALALRKVE
jgi:3-oxoacyl-[acyl-carrier-protein] synthase II